MRRSQLIQFLKTRSLLLSAVTVVPLVIVILGLTACVKYPVGDPEKSKMDSQFVGIWLAEEADGQDSFLVMVPYDSRTYFAKIMNYRKTQEEIAATQQIDCKAWLTPIGGQTFITMEPLSGANLAGVGEKFPYLVGKIRLVDGDLHLRLVDGNKSPARDADNRGELEAAIAEHVDSESLYVDEPTVFKKTNDKPLIESVFRAFHQQL